MRDHDRGANVENGKAVREIKMSGLTEWIM